MNAKMLEGVRAAALGCTVLIGFVGGAQAALVCSGGASNTAGTFTCNETVTFGPVKTDLSGAVLTLDKFTNFAAAGFSQNLTAVGWSVSSSLSASGTLTNNSSSTQKFTFNETEALTFSAGVGAPASFLPGGLVSGAGSGLIPFTLAQGASANYGFNLSTATVGGGAASVAGYGGGGTFQALVSTMTDVVVNGGGGNISLNAQTFITPQLTLTYTFQTAAVPESSSAVLMILGLAGLAMAARRRRRD